jgi:glutamyl-tRNA reductase
VDVQARRDPVNVALLGISHASAPMDVLERIALSDDQIATLVAELSDSDSCGSVYALSTCNRMEFYVELGDGAVAELPELVARHTGLSPADVESYVYQRDGADAVHHLFSVASGLDSIVLGEDQILGQVKDALDRSRRLSPTGPVINQLVQSAIRVGKRARTETDINRAGRNLATLGLSALEHVVGPLEGRSALVIGAGSMGGVVVAALRRAGFARIDVANRTPDKAQRLAETAGGQGHGLDQVSGLLAEVDLVVTCIGGTGVILTAADAADAVARRHGRPLFLLDLALPRNIAGDVDTVGGVTFVDLEKLAGGGSDDEAVSSVEAARKIIDHEVGSFVAARRAARVTPALRALRDAASTTVRDELNRLFRRMPRVDAEVHVEITQSVQRIVDKVLHGPTVRARQLAGAPDGAEYVEVLGKLFDPTVELDTEVVA